MKKLSFFFSLLLVFSFITSCSKKEDSVLKIFVRSKQHNILKGAIVRVVGDVNKDTPEYFKEMKTNESGYALFDLNELFDSYGKDDEKTAYFTVYATDETKIYTSQKVRAKGYITTTETIILEN